MDVPLSALQPLFPVQTPTTETQSNADSPTEGGPAAVAANGRGGAGSHFYHQEKPRRRHWYDSSVYLNCVCGKGERERVCLCLLTLETGQRNNMKRK